MLMWARKQLCYFQQQPHSPEALLVRGRGCGGSIFSQMSDSGLSIAHSVQAVAAEVRRGREGAGEWAGERNKGTCGW